MIKLADILKEAIIESKVIDVPQSEIDKVEKLYNYINSNLEDLKSKSPKESHRAYIPRETRYVFSIEPIKLKKHIPISVGFYNNPDVNHAGNADTTTNTDVRFDLVKKDKAVIINLAKWNDKFTLQQFEQLIEHELVHAIDSKTERGDFARAASEKNPDAFSAKDLEKYHQQPHEFDAQSTATLKVAKRNLDKHYKEDKEAREAYINLFIRLMNDLKTRTPEDVYYDDAYSEYMKYLLSDNDMYWEAVLWIADWVKDPKLYKKFRSRIVSTLS